MNEQKDRGCIPPVLRATMTTTNPSSRECNTMTAPFTTPVVQ